MIDIIFAVVWFVFIIISAVQFNNNPCGLNFCFEVVSALGFFYHVTNLIDLWRDDK